MGPGIITGFAGNDAGGVTTYTSVGAHYGVAMLWLLVLSTVGVIIHPDWGAVANGLVLPALPTGQAALVAALALVGTTITPYMQFYIQASTVDKGIDAKQYGLARIDVLFGALLTGVNAFFMIVVAGAVLFPAGIRVETAADAAAALGPLAGPSAQLLFAMGLLGASLLAATVMPLSTSYAICEAFGWESGISKNFRDAPVFMGLFTLLLVAGAAVVLLPGIPLIPLILVSQNVNGLLLPIVLVFVIRLASDRAIMGEARNGLFGNVVGIATVIGASALSIALVVVTLLGI